MLYRVIQWYTFRIKRENSQNNSRRKIRIFYDKLYFLCPTRIVQLFIINIWWTHIFIKKGNSFFFFFRDKLKPIVLFGAKRMNRYTRMAIGGRNNTRRRKNLTVVVISYVRHVLRYGIYPRVAARTLDLRFRYPVTSANICL